jgi:hypothetical protein
MANGAMIWLVIFAVSAAAFFVIAAIVAVRGFTDLQTLLRHSDRKGKSNKDESRN